MVALADTDERALSKAGKDFGVERLSTDYRALIEADDIDVIDVVTGNAAHWPVTLAALQAGKHVLCEKPVHHDYRMVEQAADLAESKGLKTKLGFTFRYAPATQYAASLIGVGFIGEPYHDERLRTEQPVARSADPAAADASHRRPKRSRCPRSRATALR